MSTTHDPYQLCVEGLAPDHLRVHSFTGREPISGAYSFDVVVTADAGAEDLERIALGRRAMLLFRVGEAPRAFYGVIAAVRHDGARGARQSVQYQIRVVPRLWLLKRRRRTRIFQQMDVEEIVGSVLREAGIAARWRLLRKHPSREYCTQYEESDYAFVTRLLAESGVYFHFAEGGPVDAAAAAGAPIPGDTVMLGDDASFYPALGGDDAAAAPAPPAPPLYYLAMQETASSHLDKITRFSARTTVRATAATYAEYDPERPMSRLVSSARSTHPFPPVDPATAPLESAPIAAFGAPRAEALDLEVYDHHGPFLFPQWGFAADEAPLMLRQKRRRASTAAGESGCPILAPGRRFTLQDHPSSHLDRAYVVIGVEHRGQARPEQGAEWKVYSNTFECAPAEVTFVPPRPRRRSAQVALTATVKGPSGEEIHTDPMGRIKVEFHWDRRGRGGDGSSCWIRTMHPWGGAGWGAQFIPRVGMEVVVVFEGGDPDKPMVIGSLYNGSHAPPFTLPASKTRSGWRTQSTPGGAGGNEISFEDQARGEQIYVHAQRDLDEVVEHDHTLLVRGEERVRVLGSRMDVVEAGLSTRVGGHSEERVAGSRSSHVDGSRTDAVTGNADVWVEQDSTTRIGGRERREIAGASETAAGSDVTLRVRGCHTTLVGTEKAQRSYVVHVEGVTDLSSSGVTEIRSGKAIVLSCGKSSLRITDDKIELVSPSVSAGGPGGGIAVDDESLRIRSKKGAQLVAETIVLKASDASLGLAKEAKLDGQRVLLNSPEQATDPAPAEPPKPTIIELVNQHDEPLANQRYLVTLADGSEVSGILDKDGRAELEIEGAATVSFPGLRGAKPS
jgi:type VI secretion system secreted protein VgrG